MILLLALCTLGLPAAALLLWRIRLCPATPPTASSPLPPGLTVSLIIPARNEEQNLALLLASILAQPLQPDQLLVVDDASTDRTAAVARAHGVTVLPSAPLPPSSTGKAWTGKTWACHQGALAATSTHLLFLDADTRLDPGGYARLLSAFAAHDPATTVLSVLPFHRTARPYEQLSLFFNLLMAAGAGGFGFTGRPQLFGQSLLLSRAAYDRLGGHRAVRSHILENLALAPLAWSAGLRCLTFGGRGTLSMRMFPHGLSQLTQSWRKAFAEGAAATPPAVRALSALWIAALILTTLLLVLTPALAPGPTRLLAAALYLAFSLQLLFLARQLGTFGVLTSLIFPIPLAFYLAIFTQSAFRRLTGRRSPWRGRTV